MNLNSLEIDITKRQPYRTWQENRKKALLEDDIRLDLYLISILFKIINLLYWKFNLMYMNSNGNFKTCPICPSTGEIYSYFGTG